MSKKANWIMKPEFDGDWCKVSCAYCYFNCPMEVCDRREYYCDCFEPNLAIDIS